MEEMYPEYPEIFSEIGWFADLMEACLQSNADFFNPDRGSAIMNL